MPMLLGFYETVDIYHVIGSTYPVVFSEQTVIWIEFIKS